MADRELDAWRREWQADTPALPDLKARVERETRMMRMFVAAEILVTVVIGGGSLVLALLSPGLDMLVLTIGVWVFIAIAWTISFLLRRGAWAPVTATTTAFLDLSILRCRRRREAIWLQVVLYTLILGFDLVWIYFAAPPGRRHGAIAFLTGPAIAWVWPVTAVLGVAAVRHRRRLTRELATLTGLRQYLRS
jgi:hypothetical protein